MATLATLATTTLSRLSEPSDPVVYLTSSSGIVPGYGLWVDKELLIVVSVGTRADGGLDVLRGQGGSTPSRHAPLSGVTIGRPDQFFSSDPVGLPPREALVNPWINTIAGKVWQVQGDETGPMVNARWWQDVTTTYGIGSLGVRTTTVTPS